MLKQVQHDNYFNFFDISKGDLMRKNLFIIFLLSFLLLISCTEKETKTETTPEVNLFSSADSSIVIVNPWSRPSAKGMNGAIFLKIFNQTNSPDTLYSVESDLADLVEIHETFMRGSNQMGMRHVDFIEISGDTLIYLQLGGFHIMLISLNKDMGIGTKGEAVLNFKQAGQIEIITEVRDMLGIQ